MRERIHFRDAQGGVFGQTVQQESGDVEEGFRKMGTEGLLLQQEKKMGIEFLSTRLSGRHQELCAPSGEQQSPFMSTYCVLGAFQPLSHAVFNIIL